MAVSLTGFLNTFPEFALAENIQTWLNVAATMHDANRWGELLDIGTYLYVAHNLAINKVGAAGGGMASGPVTSRRVDTVSVSTDPSIGSHRGAGHFNLTTYGVRYAELRRLVGMGAVALT